MNWNKYPFLRLVIALSIGIVLGGQVLWMKPSILFGVMLALMIGEALLMRFIRSYRYRWISGVLMLVIFVLVGYLRVRTLEVTKSPEHDAHVAQGREGYYVAKVCEPPSEKDKSVKTL